jgi:hypothetical protein
MALCVKSIKMAAMHRDNIDILIVSSALILVTLKDARRYELVYVPHNRRGHHPAFAILTISGCLEGGVLPFCTGRCLGRRGVLPNWQYRERALIDCSLLSMGCNLGEPGTALAYRE